MRKKEDQTMKIIRLASSIIMSISIIIGFIMITIPKYQIIGLSFYLIAIMYEIIFFGVTIIEDTEHKKTKKYKKHKKKKE